MREVLEEILEERVVSSRGRCNERAVKRKMSNYPVTTRGRKSRKIPPGAKHVPRIVLVNEQYWV